jgi:predicted GH43/DUF377 family glycosyl hydrolase
MPLYGVGSKNKNLALFPRKVNGKYAMLSRIDGVNNYLMYSDSVTQWDNPSEPRYSWDLLKTADLQFG